MPHEIVAVIPEFCSGPGWANSPLWIIERRNNKLEMRDIQPEDQPRDIAVLFAAGAAMHRALVAAVERDPKDAKLRKRLAKADLEDLAKEFGIAEVRDA